MAFPAAGGSRQDLGDVLARIRGIARSIKQIAQDLRTASAAGNIIARRPVTVMESLTQMRAQLITLAAVPGIGDYAKTQFGDSGLDIGAEWLAMRTQLDAVILWVATNIPKDTVSNRWILTEEIVNGLRVDRTFTPAETATMRTVLDALIATID